MPPLKPINTHRKPLQQPKHILSSFEANRLPSHLVPFDTAQLCQVVELAATDGTCPCSFAVRRGQRRGLHRELRHCACLEGRGALGLGVPGGTSSR